MSALAILPVILPLVGAPLAALLPARISYFLSCALVFFSAAASVILVGDVAPEPLSYAFGNWQPPFGIEYRIDPVNLPIICLIALIAAAIMPYAYRSVVQDIAPEKQSSFYALFLLCLAGLLGMASTYDIFNLYVFLEISSLASYALIASGRDPKSLRAAFDYLIVGTIGATFYLIGVGMIYAATGTLNLADAALRLPYSQDHRLIYAGLLFLMLGLGLKAAFFPLHGWLVRAYSSAPVVVVAFLSAAGTKVALYIILRLTYEMFGPAYVFSASLLDSVWQVLALGAILYGSVAAWRESNFSKLLAFSSVANVGYILLAISMGTRESVAAALVFIVNHALAKSTLFLSAAAAENRFHGLARRQPLVFSAFAVAALSLIGLPLTAGFIGKWTLLQTLATAPYGAFWVVLVLASSVLTALYMWRYLEPCFDSTSEKTAVPVGAGVTLLLFTLANLYFGIFTTYSLGLAEHAADYLFSARY